MDILEGLGAIGHQRDLRKNNCTDPDHWCPSCCVLAGEAAESGDGWGVFFFILRRHRVINSIRLGKSSSRIKASSPTTKPMPSVPSWIAEGRLSDSVYTSVGSNSSLRLRILSCGLSSASTNRDVDVSHYGILHPLRFEWLIICVLDAKSIGWHYGFYKVWRIMDPDSMCDVECS